jgi:N4-(beta-N-acetylglucosaminyl)-L-asparaginase
MHGPTRRAGAVGCLEDIATPSLVAKAVMDHTDHIILVGKDARRFAVEMGFRTQNLLTEQTRQEWLRWRSTRNPRDAYLDHEGDVDIKFTTGTINMVGARCFLVGESLMREADVEAATRKLLGLAQAR